MLGGAVAALPDGIGSCGGVSPQDVALAVAIEVTDGMGGRWRWGAGGRVEVGLDFPVLISLGGDGCTGGSVTAVVEVVLAGGAVSPQDVGFAVAVEVTDLGNLPGLVGFCGHALLGGAVAALPDLVGTR